MLAYSTNLVQRAEASWIRSLPFMCLSIADAQGVLRQSLCLCRGARPNLKVNNADFRSVRWMSAVSMAQGPLQWFTSEDGLNLVTPLFVLLIDSLPPFNRLPTTGRFLFPFFSTRNPHFRSQRPRFSTHAL